MECLKSRYDHPTADMVYAAVREIYPKISLGTVYRNLSLLVDQGEILRLSCGEGWDRYDARTSLHYHFLCRKCGRLLDLDMAPMEHINVLAGNGFDGDIEGHFAYFYGICGQCKKEEKN
jgi:Fur family peroxide stress response transcriptional regulator